MINNVASKLILVFLGVMSFSLGSAKEPKKPNAPKAVNKNKKLSMDNILDSILDSIENSSGMMIFTYKMFRDELTKIGEVSTKMKAIQDKYKELESAKKNQDPKAPLTPEEEAKAATVRQMINDINALIMQLNGHLTESMNIFAQLLQDRHVTRSKQDKKEPRMMVRLITVGFGGMMGADTICSDIPTSAPEASQKAYKRAVKQIMRITKDQYTAAVASKAEAAEQKAA